MDKVATAAPRRLSHHVTEGLGITLGYDTQGLC
jgi:hypothetical protein